jgi:hypothetical protein
MIAAFAIRAAGMYRNSPMEAQFICKSPLWNPPA